MCKWIYCICKLFCRKSISCNFTHPQPSFYLNKISGLRMRSVKWNRFPIKNCRQIHYVWAFMQCMASEGFFPGGFRRGFSQNFFQGGPYEVKFVFCPSKLKKQPFFANNFKIHGGKAPLPPFRHPCLYGDYSYLNTDMWKFEPLQSEENRSQSVHSSNAYSKPRVFNCSRKESNTKAIKMLILTMKLFRKSSSLFFISEQS